MATTKKKTAKVAKLDQAALKGKTFKQLHEELVKLQSELVDTRRSHAARELVSTARLTELRRHIARVKTALNTQKEEKA